MENRRKRSAHSFLEPSMMACLVPWKTDALSILPAQVKCRQMTLSCKMTKWVISLRRGMTRGIILRRKMTPGGISLCRIMTRVISLRRELSHGSFCRRGSFLCIKPAHIILLTFSSTLSPVQNFFYQKLFQMSNYIIFRWTIQHEAAV